MSIHTFVRSKLFHPPSSPPCSASAMATPPPPPQPFQIDLWTIFSESRRIIKAHTRHFLALSVLFLLPLAFSFSTYPFIYQLFSQSSTPTVETHLSFRQQQPPISFPTKTIFFSLLYALFVLIFSSLATGSITYSVFHGFYGRPVKLVSALKSAFTSFPRLLATFIVFELIISGFFILLAVILFSLVVAAQLLGFQVDYSSPDFFPLCLGFAIILICVVTYLQVNWVFAPVVVVVESGWGLEPLKRSKYLVRGMRWVAFSMFLFYGLLSGIAGWGTSAIWEDAAADGAKWKNWVFVLNIVTTSVFYMVILLSSFAATTVFYMYSKAIQGELAGEIAAEFATDYVSLPFDVEKVPHVVSVVYG